MAKSKNNVVTHGLSGKLGEMLVFRQLNGKTIVASTPRKTREQTEKQKQHQERFLQASHYAMAALKDAATKQAYAAAAESGQTAYNIALADMMRAPEIQAVNLAGYSGKPGDIVTVKATDDFRVTQVTVEIQRADGSLVEKGNAVLSETGIEWQYKALTDNNVTQGCKVIARAMDLPGNVTESEQLVA